MPTIPVIERDSTIYDELKMEPCDINSPVYRQKVLDFHFINDFVNTDNAILGNAMIQTFPNYGQYPAFTITRAQLEQLLAGKSCDSHYVKVCFDDVLYNTCFHIETVESDSLIFVEYRLNIFFSLLINYPNLSSIEFRPGRCKYNNSANPINDVGVIKVYFSNGVASRYYDISIPPNGYLLS